MIPGLMGELSEVDSPLESLSVLVCARDTAVDLVDEDVADAVARAIESGITWGTIAEALRGGSGGAPDFADDDR
jgi:hypothetical protein